MNDKINHASRRDFLWRLGGGLGGIALADLLGRQGLLADLTTPSTNDLNGGLHHKARVHRVIQLFMNGGISQIDTFDYKPRLERDHGRPFDPGEPIEAVTSVPGTVMKSPFRFQQYGQSGRWVSEVFPNLTRCIDEIAFVMNVASRSNVHGPASYQANTGFVLPGFPCLGSWLSYGLGSLTDNLPTFVVIPDSRGLPYNNQGNFSAGFLPVRHSGTLVRVNSARPIAALSPSARAQQITVASETNGHEVLKAMNQEHLLRVPHDSRLEARIASYELAARLQIHAPEAFDLARETETTRRHYGLDQPATEAFARSCLTARRLIERGVRFVQVWSGAGGPTNNWDNHNSIPAELPPIARSVDQPIAALLHDLGQRGLLADTLVVCNTEFGRHPFTQGNVGRDHNAGTSIAWFAGAGIRGGTAIGESDPWGWRAIHPHYCYDLHATILHLLGIDHEKLIFRNNGIDRRLTDVHGHVIDAIIT